MRCARLFPFLLVAGSVVCLLTPPTRAQVADLSVTKVDTPDPVAPGANLTYTITVTNAGPDSASSVEFLDSLPAGTTFDSLSAPGGWTCSTPAVGSGGAVSCSIDPFAVGSAVFTLVVAVDPTLLTPEITNVAAASSTTADPEPENQFGVATTTVAIDPAVVSINKTDFPDPVVAGEILTYSMTATNSSGADFQSAVVTDTLPAGTTFDSFANPVPTGWTCTTPPAGTNGTVTCTAAPFAPGSALFGLNVRVDASLPAGTTLSNTARLDVTDGTAIATREATTTTNVITPPAISATKAVNGSFTPGGSVTYTVVLTNLGPGSQGDNPGSEFVDVLPAELILVSATATSGTATATVATNTVTWDGSLAAGGGSVTITINATIDPGVAVGTTISNQGRVFFDFEGDGINESSTVTDDPSTPTPDSTSFQVGQQAIGEIPTLDTLGLTLLALLLAIGGAWRLRKRRAGYAALL
ncbi:MAG TPA: DUF11 domain-containing protein [Thermoanaerobaculia bacterium]|jgi:uncharacterized repeat protein (TIGR01451 family)|nr:DUF11 domain-containing protein [Thermoanaerobaculia bacterium]